MKKSSHLIAGLALGALLVSCSPQMFNMPIDMRHASPSGLDLGGKSFSVVYVDNGYKADSCLNHALAEGFALGLEKEYFGDERRIDLYKMKEVPGAVYSDKDTLVNLVMDSQRDVVFLLDTPDFKNVSIAEPVRSGMSVADSVLKTTAYLKIEQNIYVYDSMYQKDTVIQQTCKADLVQPLYLPEGFTQNTLLQRLASSLRDEGLRSGAEMIKNFKPTWRTEEYGIIYYDGDDWIDAASKAAEFRWKEAMDQWMELLDTKNMEKRSCASYNIALCCYMLGNYPLAIQWLDSSDRDCPIYLSSSLRKKIQSRMR